MDAQLGKLMETLHETGPDQNTVVVFWSDHGFYLGQHSWWFKTSCFGLHARVPLLISAPGYPRSQQSDALVELVNLFPTLAEVCGLPNVPTDGTSLLPVLKDPTATVKEYSLAQHPRPAYDNGASEVMSYSLRSREFRDTEWRNYRIFGNGVRAQSRGRQSFD